MRLFLTTLLSGLLSLTSLAGIYDNPQISVVLSTNNPVAGQVLKTDGQFNYWGAEGTGGVSSLGGVTITWNNSNSNNAYVSGNTNIFITFNTNLSAWSQYPATTNIDINNKNLDNVNSINLGGVTRTNWPVASQITNDSNVEGSTVMDALNTLKAGTLLIMENGPTSIIYCVTSGGHTNFVGKFYSE